MDRKLNLSIDNTTLDFTEHAAQQTVDVDLQKIHALFEKETSAPLAELEDELRAWTRSHLQNEDIDKVIALATRAREAFSVLVIIGIGGSDLSARVFHDSFNHPYHNLLSVEQRGGAPEVYFTGDTFDPRKLIGLLEMLKARNLLQKTLFNVISKSGTTTETMATLMIIRETLGDGNWQRQVLATTGLTADSVLFRMHEQSAFYGGTLLPVPDGVGGRFSAFSPVGLLFLAMTAGRDETPETRIRAALEGVKQAHKDFYLSSEHQDNVAYQLARWIHLAEAGAGKGSIVFYNYADNNCLGEWFVQLCTESVQERGTGPNVINAKGPTSNHSILNGIISGPRDKIVLFIHWEELGQDLILPKDTKMDSKLTDIEGLSMTHMQTASYRGTALDFSENGVPNATLTLPKRDIRSVCRLMRVLMDTIAVKGKLQDLHLDTESGNELTYLQDGVEGYKRNFRSFALAPDIGDR
ncbi:hypothetical protein J5I95_20340 [Candidatus Poribacteria bacterium]|nr:hypothetical protein [Candidatus Poribacteria bacterium]